MYFRKIAWIFGFIFIFFTFNTVSVWAANVGEGGSGGGSGEEEEEPTWGDWERDGPNVWYSPTISFNIGEGYYGGYEYITNNATYPRTVSGGHFSCSQIGYYPEKRVRSDGQTQTRDRPLSHSCGVSVSQISSSSTNGYVLYRATATNTMGGYSTFKDVYSFYEVWNEPRITLDNMYREGFNGASIFDRPWTLDMTLSNYHLRWEQTGRLGLLRNISDSGDAVNYLVKSNGNIKPDGYLEYTASVTANGKTGTGTVYVYFVTDVEVLFNGSTERHYRSDRPSPSVTCKKHYYNGSVRPCNSANNTLTNMELIMYMIEKHAEINPIPGGHPLNNTDYLKGRVYPANVDEVHQLAAFDRQYMREIGAMEYLSGTIGGTANLETLAYFAYGYKDKWTDVEDKEHYFKWGFALIDVEDETPNKEAYAYDKGDRDDVTCTAYFFGPDPTLDCIDMVTFGINMWGTFPRLIDGTKTWDGRGISGERHEEGENNLIPFENGNAKMNGDGVKYNVYMAAYNLPGHSMSDVDVTHPRVDADIRATMYVQDVKVTKHSDNVKVLETHNVNVSGKPSTATTQPKTVVRRPHSTPWSGADLTSWSTVVEQYESFKQPTCQKTYAQAPWTGHIEVRDCTNDMYFSYEAIGGGGAKDNYKQSVQISTPTTDSIPEITARAEFPIPIEFTVPTNSMLKSVYYQIPSPPFWYKGLDKNDKIFDPNIVKNPEIVRVELSSPQWHARNKNGGIINEGATVPLGESISFITNTLSKPDNCIDIGDNLLKCHLSAEVYYKGILSEASKYTLEVNQLSETEIKLNPKVNEGFYQNYVQLGGTVFESDNPDIASVDGTGKVTVTSDKSKSGSATITSTIRVMNVDSGETQDGEIYFLTSSVTVTVNSETVKPPTGNGSGTSFDYTLGKPVRIARWEYIENGYHDREDVSFLYAMKIKLNINGNRPYNLTYQDEPYNTYSCTKYYPSSGQTPHNLTQALSCLDRMFVANDTGQNSALGGERIIVYNYVNNMNKYQSPTNPYNVSAGHVPHTNTGIANTYQVVTSPEDGSPYENPKTEVRAYAFNTFILDSGPDGKSVKTEGLPGTRQKYICYVNWQNGISEDISSKEKVWSSDILGKNYISGNNLPDVDGDGVLDWEVLTPIERLNFIGEEWENGYVDKKGVRHKPNSINEFYIADPISKQYRVNCIYPETAFNNGLPSWSYIGDVEAPGRDGKPFYVTGVGKLELWDDTDQFHGSEAGIDGVDLDSNGQRLTSSFGELKAEPYRGNPANGPPSTLSMGDVLAFNNKTYQTGHWYDFEARITFDPSPTTGEAVSIAIEDVSDILPEASFSYISNVNDPAKTPTENATNFRVDPDGYPESKYETVDTLFPNISTDHRVPQDEWNGLRFDFMTESSLQTPTGQENDSEIMKGKLFEEAWYWAHSPINIRIEGPTGPGAISEQPPTGKFGQDMHFQSYLLWSDGYEKDQGLYNGYEGEYVGKNNNPWGIEHQKPLNITGLSGTGWKASEYGDVTTASDTITFRFDKFKGNNNKRTVASWWGDDEPGAGFIGAAFRYWDYFFQEIEILIDDEANACADIDTPKRDCPLPIDGENGDNYRMPKNDDVKRNRNIIFDLDFNVTGVSKGDGR